MDKKYVAYAGSYTHESSKGIHIYDCDVAKGRITEREEVAIDNPSFIAFSHDKNFLYSICDQGVSAYAVLEDGSLELMNVASINGMRGCHICVTSDNRFLVVSGYHDGKITVLHINADGSVGFIADEIFHKGIGSVAERNFRPHISWSTFTPDEELLCVCDPGIDQIKLYEFNHVTGKLKLYDIIRSQQESAPRQIEFSQDGKFAYVVCEMKNYINVYSYDKNSKEVKKYGDFYVVNVKISLDNCDRISASKGSVYGHLFISGFNKAYKGSIYVDDVTLTVDKKSVVKQNYENGKNSGCWYYLNRSEKEYTPAVVSFSGKTLDVTKTSLTIKKGKKATIKATAMPKTKITYQSKNKKVATVNSKGVVRGIRKGKTTILVTANGKTVKVQITVK